MNPQKRQIFILIVHYGDPKPTQALIKELLAGTKPPTAIIVVDHGVIPFVPSRGVVHVRPSENSGYGPGINIGLGVLLGHHVQNDDVVIALNNDVSLTPKTLQTIMNWCQTQTQPFVAGATLGHVDSWRGRARLNSQSVTTLPYIDGSCLVSTYQTWTNQKGFPENYFMYWEDAAFSFKAHRKGIQLKVIPHTGVEHTPSLGLPTDDKLFYLVRNGAFCLETETRGLVQSYWYVLNRIRYIYHRYISTNSKSNLIASALLSAFNRQLGKRVE